MLPPGQVLGLCAGLSSRPPESTAADQGDRAGCTWAQAARPRLDQARQGVKEYLVYDDFGCRTVPRSIFQQMRDAGLEVVALAPGGWMKGRLQIKLGVRCSRLFENVL